jgi:hypothetical protein
MAIGYIFSENAIDSQTVLSVEIEEVTVVEGEQFV